MLTTKSWRLLFLRNFECIMFCALSWSISSVVDHVSSMYSWLGWFRFFDQWSRRTHGVPCSSYCMTLIGPWSPNGSKQSCVRTETAARNRERKPGPSTTAGRILHLVGRWATQVLYMKVSRLFQSCSQPPRYRGKKWAKYQYYQVQAAILPLVAASTDNGFEQQGFRDDIQPFQVAPLRGDKDPGDRRAA